MYLIFSGAEARHRRNKEEFREKVKPVKRNDLRKNLMTISIQPLHDRVIVKRIDEGEQVRGGIIIPDTAKEKPQEGEVIAAGAGKYREDGSRQALDVKAGDRILLGKYSGSEVSLEGEELLIIREDEILGIIKRAGAAASSGNTGQEKKQR